MKTASLPPLRVSSELRAAAEALLHEDETLSGFILEAVRLHIERRETQQAFIARGLIAREEARGSGGYVESDTMLGRLDIVLARARNAPADTAR